MRPDERLGRVRHVLDLGTAKLFDQLDEEPAQLRLVVRR